MAVGGGEMDNCTKAVSLTEAEAPVAVPLYLARCFPVLGYLCQMLEAKTDMKATERAALHSILKLPLNALYQNSLHRFDIARAPQRPSLEVMAVAARTRTALQTTTTLQDFGKS